MYVTSLGNTWLPPVWSPWSDPTTYHLMGSGVRARMRSTIFYMASGLPARRQ
jgi:hypothetical protein